MERRRRVEVQENEEDLMNMKRVSLCLSPRYIVHLVLKSWGSISSEAVRVYFWVT